MEDFKDEIHKIWQAIKRIEKIIGMVELKLKKLAWLTDIQDVINLVTKTKVRVGFLLCVIFFILMLILGYFGIQATETIKYLINFFK